MRNNEADYLHKSLYTDNSKMILIKVLFILSLAKC